MKILTSNEKFYVAGIVDGEGTIAISRHDPGRGTNPSYGLFTCVTNTNMELLTWLRQKTNIGVIRPKPRQKNWKLCYQWVLVRHEIVPFLSAIVDCMIVRQPHARLMIEFIGNIRYAGPHHPLTVDESILKDLIFRDLQELNKRGL